MIWLQGELLSLRELNLMRGTSRLPRFPLPSLSLHFSTQIHVRSLCQRKGGGCLMLSLTQLQLLLLQLLLLYLLLLSLPLYPQLHQLLLMCPLLLSACPLLLVPVRCLLCDAALAIGVPLENGGRCSTGSL